MKKLLLFLLFLFPTLAAAQPFRLPVNWRDQYEDCYLLTGTASFTETSELVLSYVPSGQDSCEIAWVSLWGTTESVAISGTVLMYFRSSFAGAYETSMAYTLYADANLGSYFFACPLPRHCHTLKINQVTDNTANYRYALVVRKNE